MNLSDELRQLAELHQAGHLTEQEFADAKRRLIADGRAEQPTPPREERAVPDDVARIAEKTYQSSRWSSGNLFFPDRLTLGNDGM